MDRICETELMDSQTEATAYDQMDHAEVNTCFVNDLLTALGPIDGVIRAIDLGTGTAQIPIELCSVDERFRVIAADAAQCMLNLAEANVIAARLTDKIKLQQVDAKTLPANLGPFDVVMSNSLVHHLPEPRV
ncbi:MAG: class I SAM-dependent methyltransferase, partial [Aeoliella sp.]